MFSGENILGASNLHTAATTRLNGLVEGIELDVDDVYAMQNMCPYEYVVLSSTVICCAEFETNLFFFLVELYGEPLLPLLDIIL